MNGKEEIVDSLLGYVPLYIGMGFALFGVFYRRRHPDSPRGLRVMALSFAVAIVACFGTSAVSLATKVIEDGATGLIVPLVLVLPLGVLSLLTVRRALLGKPSTTETIEHVERRSSVRLTLTLATFAALPAYAAGYGAGAWLMAIYPDAPRLDLLLGVSATLAVVLSLIPWAVIEIRAAARRRAVANGHPSSPEIVDHVMTKATAARIDSALSYGHKPYYSLMFWAGVIIALLAAPALMQLTLTAFGDEIGTTSSLDLVWLQALTICLALGVVLVGLIAWFIVPTLRDAQNELLLSALSAEQRLRWAAQAVPAIAGLHRFPGRLADPRRSVRVLTITESGDVLLEQIAAGDLLLERSEPLDDSDDDYSEELFDDVDEEDGQLGAEGERILRVLRALAEDAGDRRFDVFALEYSTQAHIVAVGADDYLDFPEDLARRLIAA